MVRTHCTARKSTRRQPTGQLAPRDVPPQQEPQPDSPQEEEPFEIVVTVLAREDSQETQPMPQNLDHDQQEEEDKEKEEEGGNKAEGEEDEDYTPWSNAEKDEIFHDADEIKTFGDEAPIPTGRLRDLLNHINITTPPEFRIKRILCLGREEYKAIVEIISGPNVLGRHKGPAFRTTYQDAVADAAWQVITTYSRRYHDELRNTVHQLLPQRKKNKFKVSGVKANVPRMLMVYHQDVFVEMSTHLQIAQQEIQKLRDQLRDSDAMISAYQRMVAGEASDLYASDTYTWSATSSGPRAKDEPAMNSHSPSDSRTR
jgi:hypothetical protein